MEGRVVLLNDDMVGVRLMDSSYSVFRILPANSKLFIENALLPLDIEIGDSFLGALSATGIQLLLHCRSQRWIEVNVKLARSQVAARTKRYIQRPSPRAAH